MEFAGPSPSTMAIRGDGRVRCRCRSLGESRRVRTSEKGFRVLALRSGSLWYAARTTPRRTPRGANSAGGRRRRKRGTHAQSNPAASAAAHASAAKAKLATASGVEQLPAAYDANVALAQGPPPPRGATGCRQPPPSSAQRGGRGEAASRGGGASVRARSSRRPTRRGFQWQEPVERPSATAASEKDGSGVLFKDSRSPAADGGDHGQQQQQQQQQLGAADDVMDVAEPPCCCISSILVLVRVVVFDERIQRGVLL